MTLSTPKTGCGKVYLICSKLRASNYMKNLGPEFLTQLQKKPEEAVMMWLALKMHS